MLRLNGLMEYILLIIFGLVIAVIAAGRGRAKYTPPETTFAHPSIFRHYQAQSSLFANQAELAFFHALMRAVPPQYFVLTKPRLEDVIGVRADVPNPKLAFQLRGRVKSRHVDFLVIDGKGRPLCAIELDGASHSNKSAQAGDALKDGIFAASGLPLHRVSVGQDFSHAAQNIAAELEPPR